MNLLQNLFEKSKIQYSKDMTDAVPEDLIKEIQKNIRDGSSNLKLKWPNALSLVHKAYLLSNTQRPYPHMKAAWRQYEENIQFAVLQLSKTRGMDADWRMSSSVFMDSYQVDIFNGREKKTVLIESTSLDELTNKIVKETFNDYNVDQKVQDDEVSLQPRKFGIKQPFSIGIKKLVSSEKMP